MIPKQGVDPQELARKIEAADLDPYLSALPPDQFVDAAYEDNARFFVPFWALQRALVAIAFAAVLSNLLLIALRRRRELGLVSAVGDVASVAYPMSVRFDIAAPFLYGAITLAVLVVAAALPAWRTARLDVVDALRLE